jgi:hypothetical protein
MKLKTPKFKNRKRLIVEIRWVVIIIEYDKEEIREKGETKKGEERKRKR